MSNKTIAHNLEEKIRTKDVTLQENVSFNAFMLNDKTLQGLTNCGFLKPSPVQLKSIPLGRCGFDLIVKSKSGTGKTLVFTIIALESINTEKPELQALILAPTREIATQIEDVIKRVGASYDGLKVASFIGGLPLAEDLKKVQGCHIAVGAPGRIKHLFSLAALAPHSIRLLVLDEADKLLESSFQDDITAIYNALPPKKQIVATSATYPDQLDDFLAAYMISPTHVTAEIETPLLLGIRQFVAVTKSAPNVVQLIQAKNEALIRILTGVSFTQCLVFSNYQTRTESVSNFLNQKGWGAAFISAAQTQAKRLEAMSQLKDFKSRILLSTDLTARGIDAPNVDLVINYDIPPEAATYLHRMGRAGRYGARGICINLADNGLELVLLRHILATIDTGLSIAKLPEAPDQLDLWHDCASFEQIPAAISDTLAKSSRESIQNEVMGCKQAKSRKQAQKEAVSGALNSAEEALDTESLLEKLMNDEEMAPKRECKAEVSEILLESLNSVDINAKGSDDSKKRKRGRQSGERHKNETLCKNKALLSVTKLLSDPEINIDSDLSDSIANHLSSMKNAAFSDENAEDIVVERGETLEDLFPVAYARALEDSGWKSAFPGEMVAFERHLEDKSESVDEKDENQQEMEVFEEMDEDPMRWVPVVRQEAGNVREMAENDGWSHFSACYQDVSNDLWQTGLTFESVPDFDNWFYQWQEQLKGVTNYVQQNIYVQEMSKYQQSRLQQ